MPKPTSVTFGVELEFMVPWLLEGEPDPHSHIPGLPKLLRYPGTEKPEEEDAEPFIYNAFRQLLMDRGLFSDKSRFDDEDEFSANVLKTYADWLVIGDSSVGEGEIPEYNWTSVEITSPVEYDSPEAFEAIRYAVSAIASDYRVRINYSCGLHVHVGKGSERLPVGDIRRIASLVWAAEPLLLALHSPKLRSHAYARLLRHRSRLARGIPPEPGHATTLRGAPTPEECRNCSVYLGTDVRYGEHPIASREQNTDDESINAFEQTRQPGHFEPFFGRPDNGGKSSGSTDSWNLGVKYDLSLGHDEEIFMDTQSLNAELSNNPPPNRIPSRARHIPHVRVPDLPLSALAEASDKMAQGYMWDKLSYEPGAFVEHSKASVFEGALRILDAPSSCVIASLLSADVPGFLAQTGWWMREAQLGGRYTTVNFQAYDCLSMSDTKGKRTLEFRGADGSLDPWVAEWASICCGLVRFAIDAPPDVFLDVLRSCGLAQRQGATYDVIDLLDDVGLQVEAELMEARLKKYKEEWGLEFAEPAPSS
ncbi:hypothetical protein F4778DRAFT_716020 [Xylariomycetidae sp. FL2044]|nr:hypothetical protein F4778DRAFT_716020 [Xylariomycetidae sp. FL2044]